MKKPSARLMGAVEAAQRLGLSRSTMLDYAEKGRFPSHKIGARVLFAVEDIDRIIVESRREAL